MQKSNIDKILNSTQLLSKESIKKLNINNSTKQLLKQNFISIFKRHLIDQIVPLCPKLIIISENPNGHL